MTLVPTEEQAPPPELGAMTRPELRALFAYWDHKRAGRTMPARAEIDPFDIPKLLPIVMLVDVIEDPPDFRYRLVGTEVAQNIGFDITGRCLSEAEPSRRLFQRIIADYRKVVEKRRPVYSEARVAWPARDHLRYKHVALPLSDDGRRVNMLLIGIVHEAMA